MKQVKKRDLEQAVDSRLLSTKEAIQIIVDAITAKGQRKKIAEDPAARALIDFYGVDLNIN